MQLRPPFNDSVQLPSAADHLGSGIDYIAQRTSRFAGCLRFPMALHIFNLQHGHGRRMTISFRLTGADIGSNVEGMHPNKAFICPEVNDVSLRCITASSDLI